MPQFEEKLRAYLADQDREWLIEQIVRLTLDAHSLEEMDRRHIRQKETRRRQERAERVKKLALDENKLGEFVQKYKEYSREKLIQENLLFADAPPKGGDLVEEGLRSERGNELLQHAKDMLFGFLFGDGVVTALKLINNLEINEEILYGRMENIEQSTLVS